MPTSGNIVSMEIRYLTRPLQELCFADHKIALVSGARQCGKTTMARMILAGRSAGVYANWDDIRFRRQWAKDPSSIIPQSVDRSAPMVVLDEIHKHHRWKRHLKGLYDTLEYPCDILVTGSARLNVFRRSSDSLLGRHFTFRLHPFSMGELTRSPHVEPDHLIEALLSRANRKCRNHDELLKDFLRFGPFPEPLLAQSPAKARIWRRNREQLVIREDLRDMSRLPELDRVEMMSALLQERIGSLFSVASMAEDLEASPHTVKRWMHYLEELYYLFEIKPYSACTPRSLKRQGKVYLWDYSGIRDEGSRFENLVACHLLKACHFWTDTGQGDFELYFLRNKEKQEIDFLIVRDGIPWLPIEVKSRSSALSPSWRKFAPLLPCKTGIQLTMTPEWKIHQKADATLLVANAAEALCYLV